MTAMPQLGGAGDLFGRAGPSFGGFEYDKKESRNNYDMSKKKRRAPQPPKTLGQYKPKILSSNSAVNVPVAKIADTPVAPPRASKRGLSDTTPRETNPTPLVMGDKDVPLVVHSAHDEDDVDLNVSSLNLTSHDLLVRDAELGTDNPLFDLQDEASVSQHHDNLQDETFTAQPHNNPLFDLQTEALTPQQHNNPSFDLQSEASPVHHNDPASDHVTVAQIHNCLEPDTPDKPDASEPEGVYIPAPDYDEEEMTMTIAEEDDDDDADHRRSTQLFKEYNGEDFGQYLSDEDVTFEELYRRPTRPNNHLPDRKPKTEAKRSHNKKRESLPLKTKKSKSSLATSSLRTFSYADSKFGTVSRTKQHHSLQSLPDSGQEADMFVNTGASYEHFLQTKGGGSPGDAGHAFSARHDNASLVGYSGQGQGQGRSQGQGQGKESVWKKLTWKMKKQMTVST